MNDTMKYLLVICISVVAIAGISRIPKPEVKPTPSPIPSVTPTPTPDDAKLKSYMKESYMQYCDDSNNLTNYCSCTFEELYKNKGVSWFIEMAEKSDAEILKEANKELSYCLEKQI